MVDKKIYCFECLNEIDTTQTAPVVCPNCNALLHSVCEHKHNCVPIEKEDTKNRQSDCTEEINVTNLLEKDKQLSGVK